jgi:hypothetical protein
MGSLMTFNEAKAVLRQQGYSIQNLGNPKWQVTEYCVWRIADENGKPECKQFLLTAEDMKAGVYRAMRLAGKI